jgi:hypothetical protein
MRLLSAVPPRRRTHLRIVTLATVLVGLNGGCTKPVDPHSLHESATRRAFPEVPVDSTVDPRTGVHVLTVGDTTIRGIYVPLNNDSQRLPINAQTSYGAISYVWFEPGAHNIHGLSEYAPPDGKLVARVLVDTGAVVDSHVLMRLSTANTLYCLRLVHRGGVNVDGYMMTNTNGTCDPNQAVAEANKLDGKAERIGGFDDADYPHVARWGLSYIGQPNQVTDRRPAIEIRCADAYWCNVFPIGARALPAGHSKPPMDSRSHIPGWYDEQIVGNRKSGAVKPLYRGVAIPDAAIDHLTQFPLNQAVRVGRVQFDDDANQTFINSKYHDLGFVVGETEISLTRTGAGDSDWSVTIGSKTHAGRVKKHAQKTRVWGTMRWAWRDDDEDLWVRCEDGCCQVDLAK